MINYTLACMTHQLSVTAASQLLNCSLTATSNSVTQHSKSLSFPFSSSKILYIYSDWAFFFLQPVMVIIKLLNILNMLTIVLPAPKCILKIKSYSKNQVSWFLWQLPLVSIKNKQQIHPWKLGLDFFANIICKNQFTLLFLRITLIRLVVTEHSLWVNGAEL